MYNTVIAGSSCRSSVEEAVDAALRSSWEGDEDEGYEYGGDEDESEDNHRGRGGGGGGGGGGRGARELEPSTRQLALIYSLQLSEAYVSNLNLPPATADRVNPRAAS